MLDQYLEISDDTENDTDVLNPNITISDYLDYWLVSKKQQLRPNSYEATENRVHRIQEYYGETSPKVTDYTPRMADKFFKYLLQKGKKDQKTGIPSHPMSQETVRTYKSTLHEAFNQARIDGLITSNPVDGVTVRGNTSKSHKDEYLFLSESEIKELINFLSQEYPKLLPIAFFGIYYGLRRSELLGLKWDAIDSINKYVHIRHTIVRTKSIIASDQTKTGESNRKLDLFPTALACLNKIKDQQESDQLFFGNEYQNSDGYIFVWEDGRPYDPDYISKSFKKAMKKFGRPEITLHKLRHTCASILIDRGWDVKKVQYWLGHTDIKTTLKIYAHYIRHKSNLEGNDMEILSDEVAAYFS